MSESLALIISGISVVGSIAGVFFFKNQSKKDLDTKDGKIKELEGTINKFKEISKKAQEVITSNQELSLELEKHNEQISSVQLENDKLSLELHKALEQLNSSQAEIFSLTEENSIIANNSERKVNELQNQISELEARVKESEESKNIIEIIEPTESQVTKPISILFVDDSPVIRISMKKLLVGAGYDLTLANDGMDALNILENQKFDIIITDLEMPNLDGFGLVEKISENPEIKNIPTLIVTGHEEVEVKISKIGALFGLYKKPWNEAELLNRIKTLSTMKNQVL
jgi:CheY-like chemotaxis protein